MKKLLPIILTLSFCSILAQEIDTSQVKSIRYKWRIDKKTRDSTLAGILKEYKSGLFKIEHERVTDEKTKFGRYFVHNSDYKSKKDYPNIEYLIIAVGDIYRQQYFDKYGNLDSIYQKSYKDGEPKKWWHKIDKKYKRKGKLDYLIDADGNKNKYFYNFFGKLKKIEQFAKLKKTERFKDSALRKISYFKNGLLISETFPRRKKYFKEYRYEYDNKKRIIKKDENDHFFYRYNYNKFGIKKIEKVFKKKNIVMEYETFDYNPFGQLVLHKYFGNKNNLRSEYHFTHK